MNQYWICPRYGKSAKVDLNDVNLNPFYFNNCNNAMLANIYITKAREGVGFTTVNNIRIERVIVEEGLSGEVYSFASSGTTSFVFLYDCEAYGFGSGHGAHNYALFDIGNHSQWHYLRCLAKTAGQ